MAQEQDELLDERYFNEQKCQAEQQKVSAHTRPCAGRPVTPDPGKRQQDQHHARDNRLQQGCDQNQVAPFDQPCASEPPLRDNFGKRRPFEKMKVIRPVVRCRPNVELVALGEFVSARSE